MYYPCSENKDADQLRGYREADLRLCFRPCKLLVFSRTGSNEFKVNLTVNCSAHVPGMRAVGGSKSMACDTA